LAPNPAPRILHISNRNGVTRVTAQTVAAGVGQKANN
jgi:hypothetical protein